MPLTVPWDKMTDLDKGAAIMHLSKCEHEGADYATENYPARYFDNALLASMGPVAASAHAQTMDEVADALDVDEWGRLYELASTAETARWELEQRI